MRTLVAWVFMIAVGLMVIGHFSGGGSSDYKSAPMSADEERAQTHTSTQEATAPIPAVDTPAVDASSSYRSSLPTSSCNNIFAGAANIDDMHDNVTDTDAGLDNCVSRKDYVAAANANPKALDGVDPLAFLKVRCADSANSGAALCG